jgi:hypothetical protein
VKFASVVAVIVNWFSTIFIFIMTAEGVLMHRFNVIMVWRLALYEVNTFSALSTGTTITGRLFHCLVRVANCEVHSSRCVHPLHFIMTVFDICDRCTGLWSLEYVFTCYNNYFTYRPFLTLLVLLGIVGK